MFVYAELPPALYARTWKRYVVAPLSPVTGSLVSLARTVPISVKLVHAAPAQYSTRNPVSLEELSVHERLICETDAVVAIRLVGALGAATVVVAEATLELPESPSPLVARTRY